MNDAETTGCPHLRADLPPLTPRLAKLPLDARGYPVPMFVQWVDPVTRKAVPHGTGYPEFRMASSEHWAACVKFNRCWVCGETLGRHRAYVVGPMCSVNLVSAEPPSHMDCAQWSAKGCPFLARPGMKRREDDFTREQEKNVAGEMIKRNPGVTLLWHVTVPNQLFKDGKGGFMFRLPHPPESVSYFAEGRAATVDEICKSIRSGLPALLAVARDKKEIEEIMVRAARIMDEVIKNA